LGPVTAQTAAGASVTWAAADPPDTAWAALKAIRAEDVIKGGQDVSKVWMLAIINYVAPGRQASERFQDVDGNVYLISDAQPRDPGCKKYQELTCELIGDNV
jgi:hypothetical protein